VDTVRMHKPDLEIHYLNFKVLSVCIQFLLDIVNFKVYVYIVIRLQFRPR